MYIPSFPYEGNQVILSSDRVQLLAKNDSVVIFAKEAIALSSKGEVHVNSIGKTIVNSPKIELGVNAKDAMILGTSFMKEFNEFLSDVKFASSLMTSVSESDLAGSMLIIASAGKGLNKSAKDLSDKLDYLLSNTSYTQ